MIKPKKTPERRCVGCGQSFPKKDLVRIVREPDGNVTVDFRGKVSGRGAYVCKSADCLRKAEKSKRIAHSLETEIPPEVYERLREEIEAGDGDE